LQEAEEEEAPADEKQESCFFTSDEPHWGQEFWFWDPVFCSFSKLFPHVWQTYSNIGMATLTMYSYFQIYYVQDENLSRGTMRNHGGHGQTCRCGVKEKNRMPKLLL